MALSRETIIAEVEAVLSEEFEIEVEGMTPESHLNEDLGLDSLDAVDMIVALEQRLGVRLDEEEARQLETVGALYDFVARATAAANG